MFGLWKIKKLYEEDSAGAARIADVVSCMNEAIEGSLYLPPYLRQNQCGIDIDSVVVGYLDDVTGKGAAFCGLDDADYGYFLDADVNFKQTVNVTKKVTCDDELEVKKDITTTTGNISSTLGNIKADAGDVIATTISLKTHIHQITAMLGSDCALVVAGGASGTAASLTETFTITPT